MDPATTSQPFTLNRGDGSSLTFPILSPSYRIRLRNAFRSDRKFKLHESHLMRGVSDDVARKELNEFDARRLAERDVEEWVVNEPEAQVESILLSLAMDKPELLDAEGASRFKPVDDLGLSGDELVEVAAGVCRIQLVWAKEEAGEKKPDPTTAGTGATGGETPTSSDAT